MEFSGFDSSRVVPIDFGARRIAECSVVCQPGGILAERPADTVSPGRAAPAKNFNRAGLVAARV